MGQDNGRCKSSCHLTRLNTTLDGVYTRSDLSQITHYNITVNDTQPIFFYCAAPNSCIGELMVGAINPNSTQTLAAQIQAAKDADFQLAVGDTVPKEASSTIHNGPTSTSVASSSSSGGTHLSGGAIAGIVVGAVAFLVICAALFFYVGRSKSLKEVIKRQDASAHPDRASTPGPDMGYMPHDQNVPRYGSPAPPYGQHNVGETYPSGWQGSPQMHQGHLSMQSQMSGMSQEQYVLSQRVSSKRRFLKVVGRTYKADWIQAGLLQAKSGICCACGAAFA